jgi:hypothetical protein
MACRTVPLLSLWLLAACPAEGEPPSVLGQAPAQQAEISTEVACEYAARCGEISVACPDCADPEGCGGCVAEHYEIDLDQCEAQLGEQLRDGFACADLTADDEAAIDECLASLPDQACVDLAEVEDWANGGTAPSDPRDLSDACERLEALRWACDR